MNQLSLELKKIKKTMKLILQLSKNDFKVKYAGSYLGLIWSFIQPIITIFIYWFVFQVGFKTTPMGDVPYLLWFICGIIPWFFFSEALNNATNSIVEYNYLVKKVVFNISVLPIVKIVSAIFVHLFFIILIFVLFPILKINLTIYSIQFIYYTFCALILAIGLSYITSSLVPFLKDVSQIVSILLQFGFWLTPIVWQYNILSPKLQILFKFNPVYYIVEGYRDAFINHVWFWQRYKLTCYFWVLTIIILIIGRRLFKKLKPHFADVL